MRAAGAPAVSYVLTSVCVCVCSQVCVHCSQVHVCALGSLRVLIEVTPCVAVCVSLVVCQCHGCAGGRERASLQPRVQPTPSAPWSWGSGVSVAEAQEPVMGWREESGEMGRGEGGRGGVRGAG